MANLIFTVVGALLGFFLSAVAATGFAARQFRSSRTRYRVQMVMEATRRFEKRQADTGALRNQYRYSLGVMLDEFTQWPRGSAASPWPLLVDPKEDRWGRFDTHVRPVIEDINASFFVSHFLLISWTSERRVVDLMRKLSNLCTKIETTVCALDAAFANQATVKIEHDKIVPCDSDTLPMDLNKRFIELHVAWCRWLESCKRGI